MLADWCYVTLMISNRRSKHLEDRRRTNILLTLTVALALDLDIRP